QGPAARGAATAARLFPGAGRDSGGGYGTRFGALQARDERAEEHAVEAQLTGSGDLLEERRAYLEYRHRARGADGGGALRARHVARLAEAVAGIERADALAVTLDVTATSHQDVEPIVHLAFLDDLLARGVVLPVTGAQHFPDLRVRELVEELQPPQHAELLLAIDARVVFPQPLVHAGELGGEVEPALAALVRVFLHRHRHHHLDLLRHLLAQRVDRRGRGIDDLVQQLLQVAGTERPRAGEQLVHHRSERVQVRAVGELQALHLLGRHVGGAAGDALDARDIRVRHQGDAEVDDAHVAVLR